MRLHLTPTLTRWFLRRPTFRMWTKPSSWSCTMGWAPYFGQLWRARIGNFDGRVGDGEPDFRNRRCRRDFDQLRDGRLRRLHNGRIFCDGQRAGGFSLVDRRWGRDSRAER